MFSYIGKTALLLMALHVFYSPLFSQNCSIHLSGHVEDKDTKELLGGANVTLLELNKTVLTDSKGDFVFSGLCGSTYTLQISHISCDTVTKPVLLQKDLHLDINMPHFRNSILKDVIVTTQKGVVTSGYLQQLRGRDLDEAKGVSLSDALSKINGITLLQTGATISKPVLHGLHSNRILTINNGVRQEGQQWGNEHAPEIDPFIADNLVVIKGVDELRYGSDAVGGVIMVNPKPLRFTPGYYAELNGGYFTNNHEYVVSGMFEQTFKKLPAFSYRLQGTVKQGANVTTPGYRLNNTGLKEQNFSVTTGWKKENYNLEAFYSQFATTLGIFTGSHVTTRGDLEARIDSARPSDVFLGENTYRIDRPYQSVLHRLLKLKSSLQAGNHRFSFQFARQFDHRQEYDIVRNQSLGSQLNLRILTYTEDATWEHPKLGNLQGTVGLSAMQQDNWYSGRYFIPNYTAYTYGAYWLEKWIKNKWEFQGGFRYDNKAIDTKRVKTDNSEVLHSFDFSTIASSFNADYSINKQNRVNAGVSLSSRAPYMNELLSDGIHQGDGVYYLGDINLKTERAVNFLGSYRFDNTANTLSLNASVYYNLIRNFIYQQPEPDRPVQTISGAYPLYVFRQTNAALKGLDVSVKVNLTKPLELTSKVALLRARNRSIADWLILMPSDRWSNELTYNFKDNGKHSQTYLSLEAATTFRQTRVPDDTNGKQDYAPPPPGYTLLNLNAATTIRMGNLPVTVGISGRNLLNTRYREYLNTFRYFTDEMGRNINIRLKIPFEKLIRTEP